MNMNLNKIELMYINFVFFCLWAKYSDLGTNGYFKDFHLGKSCSFSKLLLRAHDKPCVGLILGVPYPNLHSRVLVFLHVFTLFAFPPPLLFILLLLYLDNNIRSLYRD